MADRRPLPRVEDMTLEEIATRWRILPMEHIHTKDSIYGRRSGNFYYRNLRAGSPDLFPAYELRPLRKHQEIGTMVLSAKPMDLEDPNEEGPPEVGAFEEIGEEPVPSRSSSSPELSESPKAQLVSPEEQNWQAAMFRFENHEVYRNKSMGTRNSLFHPAKGPLPQLVPIPAPNGYVLFKSVKKGLSNEELKSAWAEADKHVWKGYFDQLQAEFEFQIEHGWVKKDEAGAGRKRKRESVPLLVSAVLCGPRRPQPRSSPTKPLSFPPQYLLWSLMAHPLTYPSLQSILHYQSAEKRRAMAKHVPDARRANRHVPYHFKSVRLSFTFHNSIFNFDELEWWCKNEPGRTEKWTDPEQQQRRTVWRGSVDRLMRRMMDRKGTVAESFIIEHLHNVSYIPERIHTLKLEYSFEQEEDCVIAVLKKLSSAQIRHVHFKSSTINSDYVQELNNLRAASLTVRTQSSEGNSLVHLSAHLLHITEISTNRDKLLAMCRKFKNDKPSRGSKYKSKMRQSEPEFKEIWRKICSEFHGTTGFFGKIYRVGMCSMRIGTDKHLVIKYEQDWNITEEYKCEVQVMDGKALRSTKLAVYCANFQEFLIDVYFWCIPPTSFDPVGLQFSCFTTCSFFLLFIHILLFSAAPFPIRIALFVPHSFLLYLFNFMLFAGLDVWFHFKLPQPPVFYAAIGLDFGFIALTMLEHNRRALTKHVADVRVPNKNLAYHFGKVKFGSKSTHTTYNFDGLVYKCEQLADGARAWKFPGGKVFNTDAACSDRLKTRLFSFMLDRSGTVIGKLSIKQFSTVPYVPPKVHVLKVKYTTSGGENRLESMLKTLASCEIGKIELKVDNVTIGMKDRLNNMRTENLQITAKTSEIDALLSLTAKTLKISEKSPTTPEHFLEFCLKMRSQHDRGSSYTATFDPLTERGFDRFWSALLRENFPMTTWSQSFYERFFSKSPSRRIYFNGFCSADIEHSESDETLQVHYKRTRREPKVYDCTVEVVEKTNKNAQLKTQCYYTFWKYFDRCAAVQKKITPKYRSELHGAYFLSYIILGLVLLNPLAVVGKYTARFHVTVPLAVAQSAAIILFASFGIVLMS
ncbi:unnamed protein product [Caenorhabditis sp. 36 PRJEB53466]|nr:unnamed protein product [Caenorhabditis sp. 36 PRJEB53466]